MILGNSKKDIKERERIVKKYYSKKLGIKEITDLAKQEISNLSTEYVSRFLKRYKFSFKEKRGRVTERKNMKNPFKLGNRHNEYWLGFFLADGSMDKQKTNIMLFSCDVEFLKTFNKHAGVQCSEYITKRVTEKRQDILQLQFGNQRIWEYLYTIGCTPNKGKTLCPKFELNWNIVRGIFDGDGSISKGEFKITSGSICMVEKLKDFFEKYSFKTVIVQKGTAFDIYIRWTNGSRDKDEAMISKKRLFQLLYSKNAKYQLDRKKQAFSTLLK